MHHRPPLPAFDRSALEDACMRLGLRRVILFGSRATGDPPPHDASDLDLAVSRDASSSASWWDWQRELGVVFPDHALDVIDLSEADPLFRWEIMREGVRLWGDELDFLELRAFAYRDFVDSADLRELERALFRKRIEWVKRRLDEPTAA